MAAKRNGKREVKKSDGDDDAKVVEGYVVRTQAGIEITPKDVERYAALGINLGSIGAMFGISDDAMRQHCARHPVLRTAYYKGRARGVAVVASRLMRNVDNDNVAAQIFYLKNVAGWADDWHAKKPDPVSGEGTDAEDLGQGQRASHGVLLLPHPQDSKESWEQRARDYYVNLGNGENGSGGSDSGSK